MSMSDLDRRDATDGIDQQVVGAVIDHESSVLLLKRPVPAVDHVAGHALDHVAVAGSRELTG